MKAALVRVSLAIAVIVAIAAPDANAADPTLTGTWTLGVEGDHVIPMAMVVTQDGTKISGTIAMPINQQGDRRDIAFEGEVTAAGLTFATKEGKPLLEFIGKANDDGSLTGTVTMGGTEHKMNWTAERLKERKKG
jgi:hypothetical protein